MKSYWILPDTDSTGAVQILLEEKTQNLSEFEIWKQRPKEIFPAIPKEIMVKYQNKDVIYAQYARMKDFNIFCLSFLCGKDSFGRVVQITNLQLLEKNERPSFDIKIYLPQKTEIEKQVSIISDIINDQNSAQHKKISTMIEAFDTEFQFATFSSEILNESPLLHDWMPKKKQCFLFTIIEELLVGTMKKKH